MRQVNRLSSRTKVVGILNFSFSQNGGRENIGKNKDQGNNAAYGYVVLGKNRVVHNDIKCYTCQTLGHYADKRPQQTGKIFTLTGIIFSQVQYVIKKTCLWFKTCPSISISNNPIMVKNVKK